MENTDQHIKDLFSSRLKEMETPVPDHIWSGIENQLAISSAAGSSAVAKVSLLKWAAAAVITSTVVTAGYFLLRNDSVPAPPKTEQQSEAATTQPILTQEPGQATSSGPEKQVQLKTNSEPAPSEIVNPSSAFAQQEPEEIISSSEPEIQETTSTHQNAREEKKPEARTNEKNTSPPVQNTPVSNPSSQNKPAAKLSGTFTTLPVDPESLRWFFFSADDRAASYEWNISDGSSYSDVSTGHTFSSEGTYDITLKVTNADGKTITTEKTINVYRPARLNVPNSFSPGSNGKNDRVDFLLGSRNIRELVRLSITDSKGAKIYESTSSTSWNGETQSGEIAPAGRYLYVVEVIDISGEKTEKAGTLQLFRD